MSGWIQREDRLFDPASGALVGYIDLNGREQLLNAPAIQALVSGGGIFLPRLTFIGDSILDSGRFAGARVNSANVNSGFGPMWASIETDASSTGTVEYVGASKTARYKAPGDSAFGAWVTVTKSGRKRMYSGNGQWLESNIYFSLLGSSDVTRTITFVADPYTANALRGVPDWIKTLTNGSVEIVNVCSPGARVLDVIDQLGQIPRPSGTVIAQVGTNDLRDLTDRTTLEARFRALIQALASYPAIMLSVPAYGWDSAARRSLWAWMNQMIPRWCSEYGVSFCNAWQATVDQSSTTSPATDMIQSDKTHPTLIAAYWAVKKLLAAPVIARLGRDAEAQAPFGDYHATDNPRGNLIPGTVAMLQGSGGTAGTGASAGTGGIATQLTIARTAGAGAVVASKQEADSGDGTEWQRLTISGSAAGESFRIMFNGATGSTIPTAGTAVKGRAQYRLVSGSARAIELRLQPIGPVDGPYTIGGFAVDTLNLPVPHTGTVETPPCVMPVGVTNVRWMLYVVAGGTDAVVDVRYPAMLFTDEMP